MFCKRESEDEEDQMTFFDSNFVKKLRQKYSQKRWISLVCPEIQPKKRQMKEIDFDKMTIFIL